MRLVRLELRNECPFWNLPPVELSKDNPMSPLLDADRLADRHIEIIEKSARNREIWIIGPDNSILETIGSANIVEGNYIDTSDVEEEDDAFVPDIVSVTSEDLSQDEESEAPSQLISDILEEAEVLLKRNGNTVKKTILKLPDSKENHDLLRACFLLENQGKMRDGVVKAISEQLLRYK